MGRGKNAPITLKIFNIFLGFASFIPAIFFFFTALFFDYAYENLDITKQMEENYSLARELVLILCLILIVSYIFFIFLTKYVPKGKKMLWSVVLVVGNVFAVPFFWTIYVRKLT